jgi:CubicO group peptidase (beta-lactamase class C family)
MGRDAVARHEVIDMMRVLRYLLLLAPVSLAGLLLTCGGCDVRYVVRVLVHGDSKTDDYLWKRSMPVSPSSSPVPWPEAPGCGAVAAAFAEEPDATDMAAYLGRGGALALVVVRNGAIACEWYGNGGARERPAAAFSISKTVTSLILARAVAEGRLDSIDDSITAYLPALATRDARFAAISLASLVDMRSGIAFDAATSFPWVNRDPPRVYYASDLAKTALEHTRIEAPPGGFVYNDYAPNLIGLALERGYGARLADGPMQALWTDLGAEYPAAWSVDDRGFAWHESGLVVTARDLARVGWLMLERGKVGDRQVAPASFLARSLDPVGRKPVASFAGTELGYRNGWWVSGDRALYAMGRHGQIMVVSLATRTVMVRMGHDGHDRIRRMGFDGHDETNVSIATRLARVADRLGPP